MGHPEDCNHKRTNSGKSRDNEKKEVTTNPRQKEDYKNDCIFKTNVQFMNHHQVSEQRFQTQSGSKHAINWAYDWRTSQRAGWVQIKFEPLSFVS